MTRFLQAFQELLAQNQGQKTAKYMTATNRNFVGRMGPTSSEIYLANPAVAAASAVLGRIGSPAEL